MQKRVSIIVPHYNDLAGLAACLDALGRQTLQPHEIVVGDNTSPQGEAAVAAVIAGRAKLVVVGERGAGPARNGAVAAASGEILAFTDSDCLPDADWLRNGVAALADCDFAGGAMRVLVEDPEHLTPAEAFEMVFAFDNAGYVLRKGFTVTANLFCPREVFDQVGPFRVGVPEDLEWCHRARDKGFRIGYAADALVGHPARRTWTEIERKWARLNVEAFGLAVARPNGRLKWLIKSLAMPAAALVHTPKVLRSKALKTSGDRLSALAMLYRLRLWRGLDSVKLLANDR